MEGFRIDERRKNYFTEISFRKSKEKELTMALSPFHTRYPHRLLAVLLAAVMALPLSLMALAAQETGSDPSPIIYVIGRTPIYDDPASPNRKELADADSGEVVAAVKEALPYAAKAVLLGQWDEYVDKAYELIIQFFDGYALNENGEVTNSSGNSFTWSESGLSRNYKSNDPYTYQFMYDARLSPLEIADELNEYIEAVKRVTGKDKVSLIGRCLGTNIMMAYIYKYQEPQDYAGLDTVVFYDSSFLGVDPLEAAMSGTVKIEPDAAGNYLANFDLSLENETLAAVVPLTLQMLRDTYGIEITAQFAQDFYGHIKDTLVRRFLLNSIGSTPGYWSMVYEHYDEAKAYLFGDTGAAEQYAGLIAKLDNYRFNVQLRYPEIIAGMQAADVEVAAVCKYGFRGYPLYENSKALTDGDTTLNKQSFGAVCSEYDGTLEEAYLRDRLEKGFGAYLSPDGQVDASTGLLPDTTWYVKNLYHNTFSNVMDFLLNAICRNRDFTVTSAENSPRFLFYQGGNTVVPMTEDNCDPNGEITHTGAAAPVKNPLRVVVNFFRYVFKLIKILFSTLKK